MSESSEWCDDNEQGKYCVAQNFPSKSFFLYVTQVHTLYEIYKRHDYAALVNAKKKKNYHAKYVGRHLKN